MPSTGDHGLSRLQFLVEPEADEPLVGFLHRVAARNRYPDPAWLAELARIPFRDIGTAAVVEFDMAPVGILLDQPEPRLRAMTYWPDETGLHVFNGHPLAADMITLGHRRICPLCLIDDPRHRMAWDLSVSAACTVHAIRLVDRCHCCDRRLDWSSASPATCACGAGLLDAIGVPLDEEDLIGPRCLEAACDVGRGTPVPVPAGRLGDMGAGDLMILFLNVGWYVSGETDRPRPIKILEKSGPLYKVLSAGYQAFADWPHGLHRALDRLAAAAEFREGRYGTAKEFGPLLDWALYPENRLAARSGLADEIRHRLGARPGFRSRKGNVMGGDMTLTEAMVFLGRNRDTIRSVLTMRGLVVGGDGRGRGGPVLFDRAAVTRLKAEMDELADQKALRKILGCGAATLASVLDTPRMPRATGAAAELYGRPCWWRGDAEALLDAIETGYPGAPFADGLRRLLGLAVETMPVDDGCLSLDTVAAFLKLKRQVIGELCERGIIRSAPAVGRRGRRVPASELERFGAEYVVASRLGLDAGRHRGWAARRLIEEGVVPVLGGGGDGGRQYVFRRAEVEGVLMFLELERVVTSAQGLGS